MGTIQDDACPVEMQREEGLRGPSQCGKLGPELNADIVIIHPRNRKALVTPKKPVFQFLPGP